MKSLSPLFFLLLITPFLFTQCSATKKLAAADDNKETIRMWFEEGWNKQKFDEMLPRCFTEDWSDGNPLRPDQTEGLEGMRELVKNYGKAFPDSYFTITHLVADEKYVVIRWEVAATHKGEILGIKPTGRRITTTGMGLYEMENGKVKVTWQETDMWTLINQIKN